MRDVINSKLWHSLNNWTSEYNLWWIWLVGFPSFWRVSNDQGRKYKCIAEVMAVWLHTSSATVCYDWLVFEAWNYAVVWQGLGLVGSWELQRAAPGPKEARHNLCHCASCWWNVLLEERDVREIPLDNGAISTQLSFPIGSFLPIATFPLWCCWKAIENERIVSWLPAAENKWVSLQTTPVCNYSPRCHVAMGEGGVSSRHTTHLSAVKQYDT